MPNLLLDGYMHSGVACVYVCLCIECYVRCSDKTVCRCLMSVYVGIHVRAGEHR